MISLHAEGPGHHAQLAGRGCASVYELKFRIMGHRNTRRLFCTPSVPHGFAATPFPKRADRRLIVSAGFTRQRCQSSERPCGGSKRTPESISLVLLIGDPAIRKSFRCSATHCKNDWQRKPPLPAV